MKVLITGFTGFMGSHLADHLLEVGGFEIWGMHRWRSRLENVEHLAGRVRLVEGDVTDAGCLRRVLADVRPDYVFHLAAQSFVPTSWAQPDATLSNNVRGQLNLFEVVRELELPVRIQIAGSSEEYGLVHPDEVPITEDNPLRPLSPYAVSKVTQDLLAWQYFRSYGLDVVRTRAFNHTGPRRGEVFALSNFASQIVQIEGGRRPPVIHVGNLDATRDFTDVRDVARAYLLALQEGRSGQVYNICSGNDIRIGDGLELLLSLAAVRIEVREDPARLRPSDVPILRGSAARFHADTGWEPRIPFARTLEDLLEYWRQRAGLAGSRA